MDHLSFVVDPNTRLFHGALYRNRPTPSGCVRLSLSTTTTRGHALPSEAIAAIASAFPGVPGPDTVDLSRCDTVAATSLEPGWTVTVATPRLGDAGDVAFVELTRGRSRKACDLTPSDVDMLVELGRLEMESTSGRDPNLHYVYDHYVQPRPLAA